MTTLPGRRGQVTSLGNSPLPQEEAGGGAKPVRLTSGFTQFLPPRSFVFFQRVYLRDYPRPLQVGGLPPYPTPIPIASIQVPNHQGLIIKSTAFKVFEASGVGVNDSVEVENGRATTVFGFQTAVGNRGLTDFSTNVTTGAQGFLFSSNLQTPTQAPQVGAGRIYPFTGPSQAGLENFAFYGQPNEQIDLTAFVLQAPPFDTRRFSVELTGYLVGWVQMQKILDRLAQ